MINLKPLTKEDLSFYLKLGMMNQLEYFLKMILYLRLKSVISGLQKQTLNGILYLMKIIKKWDILEQMVMK